jgi:hypothetical protein
MLALYLGAFHWNPAKQNVSHRFNAGFSFLSRSGQFQNPQNPGFNAAF